MHRLYIFQLIHSASLACCSVLSDYGQSLGTWVFCGFRNKYGGYKSLSCNRLFYPPMLFGLPIRVHASTRVPNNDFHWSITGTRRSVYKQTQEKQKQKKRENQEKNPRKYKANRIWIISFYQEGISHHLNSFIKKFSSFSSLYCT